MQRTQGPGGRGKAGPAPAGTRGRPASMDTEDHTWGRHSRRAGCGGRRGEREEARNLWRGRAGGGARGRFAHGGPFQGCLTRTVSLFQRGSFWPSRLTTARFPTFPRVSQSGAPHPASRHRALLPRSPSSPKSSALSNLHSVPGEALRCQKGAPALGTDAPLGPQTFSYPLPGTLRDIGSTENHLFIPMKGSQPLEENNCEDNGVNLPAPRFGRRGNRPGEWPDLLPGLRRRLTLYCTIFPEVPPPVIPGPMGPMLPKQNYSSVRSF